jgi:hypothetical protein
MDNCSIQLEPDLLSSLFSGLVMSGCCSMSVRLYRYVGIDVTAERRAFDELALVATFLRGKERGSCGECGMVTWMAMLWSLSHFRPYHVSFFSLFTHHGSSSML